MTTLVKTFDGDKFTVDDALLEAFSHQIRGSVITPSDDNYDEERQIWNGMIDRKPGLIVQCAGTADVIYAVKFAKKHNLQITIRGAGHNIGGRALDDDALLIDLSKLRTVQVDPEAKTIVVSPGATLGDIDHETQAFGLALPVGINSTTGISGLTLGGGFGWISRKYGLTIDSLLSAEVVTVDGERVYCDKNTNADLFWAICGGGGNFGIVTSFTFQVYEVGPMLMAGPVVFSHDEAKSVLTKYRDFAAKCPEDFAVWAVMRKAPPFPFLDAQYHGKDVLILVGLHLGTMEEGEQAFAKIREMGTPLGDGVSPHAFTDFQAAFDPLLTPGARNYWKSHNYVELPDALIDTIVDYSSRLPSDASEIFIGQLGGQTKNRESSATAYPHRDVEFVMNVHTRWEEAADDERCVSWARECYKDTLPYATGGVYSNFVSSGDDSVEQAFGDNYPRLVEVKGKYDPHNVLRSNINVHPS